MKTTPQWVHLQQFLLPLKIWSNDGAYNMFFSHCATPLSSRSLLSRSTCVSNLSMKGFDLSAAITCNLCEKSIKGPLETPCGSIRSLISRFVCCQDVRTPAQRLLNQLWSLNCYALMPYIWQLVYKNTWTLFFCWDWKNLAQNEVRRWVQNI